MPEQGACAKLEAMSGEQPIRVLVTGARVPAALEIARALAAEGAQVWAGDSIAVTPAGASRSVAGRLLFPSPVLDFEGFRAAVSAFTREKGITLVVPVSEEIFYLARMERELAPAKLLAPPLAMLRELHSKLGALRLAEGCGIRIPKTLKAENAQELSAAAAKLPGAVLKPEFSRGAYELGASPRPSKERPWLVQERLAGRELSLFCVAEGGRLLAHACYEPLYRFGSGASLYFRPVESEPAAAFARVFAAKHALSAQLSFDLMENVDGSLSLIECNPRPTSGAHLMPAGWGKAYRGQEIHSPPAPPAPPRARAAKLAVLLLHFLPALRQGKLLALLARLLAARDSTFRWHDPLPALALQLSALEILWRSRRWPVPAGQAFTWDLEWNGEGP